MTAVPVTLRLRREGSLRSRAARGDATAFAAAYERHHQALYRYCRSILRHEQDAQDALQSTFARAFAALQDEQRDFELKPWLFRIAHNEAISILRRRRETSELDDLPGNDAETEDRVSEREALRVLRHDLADLPDRQRSALVLRELNGLSHTEIATVLEITPSAVKQSIFEARSALFSCREGREMACHDVRRMLSDGDGRVLRGRGVRAHLRSCPDCRRFKTDLEHRPAALRMLAPPLPTAGAAALLAQLLGGPTMVKLLACVAIAGTSTTIAAVEMHHAPKPAPPQAEAASKPTVTTRASQAVPIVPVATSAPQATRPVRAAPAKPTLRKRKPARRERRPVARDRGKLTSPGPRHVAAVAPVAAKRQKPEKAAKPQKAKPEKPPHPPKPEKPKPPTQAKSDKASNPKQPPPAAAAPVAPQVPPGQTNKHSRSADEDKATKIEPPSPVRGERARLARPVLPATE